MLSLTVNDVKTFMSHLFTGESFDRFYLVEAAIKMGISYHIDGHLNKEFFDTDIRRTLTRNYSYWKETRPKVLSLIRGKQLPLRCKIILAVPDASLPSFIEKSGVSFRREDIDGMYLNIIYDPNHLTLTTGISYRIFTMDKRLEHAFDDYIRSFLSGLGIE